VRLTSGIEEWDRVLGGGIVPGSVALIGGDPGVGKSTLLVQVADAIAQGSSAPGKDLAGRPGRGAPQNAPSVVYVSGEESLAQLALRARRLTLGRSSVSFAAETNLAVIADTLAAEHPSVCIVDSIQSVYDPAAEAGPGSVTQLRDCTLRLVGLAKERGIAVLLVGHVTKEGLIAGPKLLEHLVDVVLYLEGERLQAHRILRGVKNRFGPTSEVGVFEMRHAGMTEVADPSAAFLAGRLDDNSGSAMTVTLEGTRPLLLEVQALVSRSTLASPRRVANGMDYNRVALLAAVLAKRANVPLHTCDIHVNVVGGVRVEETAADLAATLAMISSYRDRPLDGRTVALGEVGLGGELRGVGQMDRRLAEAARFGFVRAIVPRGTGDRLASLPGVEVLGASTVREAARLAGVD
jgi:DNA repair protein RadA/Sms